MFCPNCGANNTTEQKFCRSCGLNLEKTAESLLMQIPSAQSANLMKQEKWLEKFGTFAFGGFVTVVLLSVVGLIYAIIRAMIEGGKIDIISGVLIILFIIFAMLLLSYVVLTQITKSKKKQMRDEANNQFEAVKTTDLLEEKPFIPVPSVIEDTTDLLHVENKTKKFE